MSVLGEVLSANDAYAASFGEKADLKLPPRRRFAILTCMDARLDPAKYAGLTEGDAHVIRNAGGRASDDAIPETEQPVVDDLARIRAHPLVPGRIPVYGYVYDVRTGKLGAVPDATEAGRAR
jgi:carbonic anhydrase